jgi:drug/metabolite transporter (DMT)-like permease
VGLVTGDRPSALQSAGALVGLVGIVLASREGADEASDELAAAAGGGRRDARLAAGVGLALVAGLGFGSFFVAMDVAADYDPLWANLVNRGTSLSLGVLAVVAFRPSFRGVGRRDLPVLVALGLLEMGANVGFAFAATKGLLSLTSILSSLYPVVVVFLSWLILHERLHRTQRLGVAAALLGASLIAAG